MFGHQSATGEGQRASTIEPWMPSDDRGNAAFEKRGIRMPESTKHYLDERAVAAPIPTPISNSYTVDRNEAEITSLQIAGRQKVYSTLVTLPHLLTHGCQEETYAGRK